MKVRPFHHQRPLAAVTAAYGAGVWAGVSFAWVPLVSLLGFLCALGAAALLSFRGRKPVIGFMAMALFCGVLLGGWHSHPALPRERRYTVTGVLTGDA